jgi:glycosyltransferase involved in cell wall biosynthesis
MPVLDEAGHIEAAVESILRQSYSGPVEIVLALGPSTDDTDGIVGRICQRHPEVTTVRNPLGTTPEGLNIAIRASRHPIVVRVDAHSELPEDYTAIAVSTMLRTGADNVGGVMSAVGITPFEQAVAHAYGSPIGLGGTPLHVGGKEGAAETVYLGVFRRSTLDQIGLFDENIRRGQDWDLNRRIRESGGVVWFTPELRVTYRPRSSLDSLLRQFVNTGIWRGELSRRHRASRSIRYLAPPVALLAFFFGLVLGMTGVIAGSALAWALLIPGAYLAVVVIAAFGARLPLRAWAWYLIVLPCIHFSWGFGFLLGFAKLTGKVTAHQWR